MEGEEVCYFFDWFGKARVFCPHIKIM